MRFLMCVPRRTNSFISIMDKHLVNPKSVWARFGGVSVFLFVLYNEIFIKMWAMLIILRYNNLKLLGTNKKPYHEILQCNMQPDPQHGIPGGWGLPRAKRENTALKARNFMRYLFYQSSWFMIVHIPSQWHQRQPNHANVRMMYIEWKMQCIGSYYSAASLFW